MRDHAGPVPESPLPPDALERLAALCGDSSLVVFDLETTGADRLTDRIVEIAALRITRDGTHATFERRVNPGMRIPKESTAVHGISDADVRYAPTFREIARDVGRFFEGCDLAGYNVRAFDVPVLVRELERAGVPFPLEGRRIVDAQTIYFKKEPRDLGAALRFFAGREHERAHSALADVYASAEVLAGQLLRYADLPRSLDELHRFSTPAEGRFVDLEKRFFWRDGQAVFAFGEFRGKLLSDVATANPAYLDWILSKDFPHDTKRIVRDAQRGVFPVRNA